MYYKKKLLTFFYFAGPNFLNFKSKYDPLGKIEEKEENRDLASRHDLFWIGSNTSNPFFLFQTWYETLQKKRDLN